MLEDRVGSDRKIVAERALLIGLAPAPARVRRVDQIVADHLIVGVLGVGIGELGKAVEIDLGSGRGAGHGFDVERGLDVVFADRAPVDGDALQLIGRGDVELLQIRREVGGANVARHHVGDRTRRAVVGAVLDRFVVPLREGQRTVAALGSLERAAQRVARSAAVAQLVTRRERDQVVEAADRRYHVAQARRDGRRDEVYVARAVSGLHARMDFGRKESLGGRTRADGIDDRAIRKRLRYRESRRVQRARDRRVRRCIRCEIGGELSAREIVVKRGRGAVGLRPNQRVQFGLMPVGQRQRDPYRKVRLRGAEIAERRGHAHPFACGVRRRRKCGQGQQKRARNHTCEEHRRPRFRR